MKMCSPYIVDVDAVRWLFVPVVSLVPVCGEWDK
jgi:hypothetical protein